MKIKGIVTSGGGESSKWMPEYIPWLYPGTLNVQLESDKPEVDYFISIQTHYKNGTRCAKIANCKINDIDAYIIMPPLGRKNKRFLELGATFKIREKFNLQDNDEIIIEFIN